MELLRDRRPELEAANVRAFGISRDSPWTHIAWKQALDLDFPLLSDWNGDATRGFGVSFDLQGMEGVAARSAFLIEGDTVRASWMLGREMPDVDAVIAAASSLSR